ncbi:DMT family transporter [Loktanella sp. SALINAS62]|uniref:DMT family transporter n=1 Tax=Loktanella sp. SALINAS62 TaxID=2706124 RepID=UPI001B8CD9D8|nr:DMT family transporter [Loktanella sp. SALINAS62]MBS1302271.1 DMT family transporter [Loktanella sp. SALINAS62]
MDIKAMLMGLAFAAMWSSAFTSARVIVEFAPPLTALAARFLASGIVAVGIALIMGQRMRLTRNQWRGVIIFGVCQNALYLGMNFIAMQTVEASLASIMASTMPLLVAFAGWVVFGRRLPMMGVAGLLAGFAGVAIIMSARLSSGSDPYGIMLCALAAVSITVATLSVAGAASGGNLMMIVGLQMFVGFICCAVPAALMETPVVDMNWRLIVAFVYTVLVPGVLATLVWFALVGRIGAVKASTFHFLNPFLGVLIAAILLGEQIGLADVLGVAVIAAGILAVQVSKQRPVPPPV